MRRPYRLRDNEGDNDAAEVYREMIDYLHTMLDRLPEECWDMLIFFTARNNNMRFEGKSHLWENCAGN